MRAMWLTFWSALLLISLAGAIASASSLRFSRRVASEARAMWSASANTRRIDTARIDALPPPVQRYLRKAIRGRTTAVRTVRLRHGGTFRTSLDGAWFPIRGEQYLAANPPAFVWWGRIRVAPAVWVDARDRSVDGEGRMLVMAESTVPIANRTGPELDQGALLRLLGEMTWQPTTFLDERYVRWTAMDDRHAQATVHAGGREATGLFEFGDDDLPLRFSADRYRDLGDGTAALTPFAGDCGDFREVGGLLVPFRVVATWRVDDRTIPYARFEVERIDFDATAPF